MEYLSHSTIAILIVMLATTTGLSFWNYIMLLILINRTNRK
jgi:hypothetical protein